MEIKVETKLNLVKIIGRKTKPICYSSSGFPKIFIIR